MPLINKLRPMVNKPSCQINVRGQKFQKHYKTYERRKGMDDNSKTEIHKANVKNDV